jgi:hypothetical protein
VEAISNRRIKNKINPYNGLPAINGAEADEWGTSS